MLFRSIDAEAARTMTAMLKRAVEEGTGKAAAIEGRDIAGKTGTTEMPGTGGEGASDNWFVGYTPGLVGAVWLGYDNPDRDHYLTTTSRAAALVFQALMSQALQGRPAETFPDADGSSDRGKGDEDGKKKREKKDEAKRQKEEKKREEESKKEESKKEEERKEKEGKRKEKEERKREEEERKRAERDD